MIFSLPLSKARTLVFYVAFFRLWLHNIVLASEDKGDFLANGESSKINDLLVPWCNYSGWKHTNLSQGRRGGWHTAKGLVKGDSLWLTTGPEQSILCRYYILAERRRKALKTSQMVFHSYWSAPFYHDLAPPRPYTFLRVYETHKSESCYRVTLGCEQRGSEVRWCNWSFWDGGLLSYFITRIPLHFQAAGKRTDKTDGVKTKRGSQGCKWLMVTRLNWKALVGFLLQFRWHIIVTYHCEIQRAFLWLLWLRERF